MALPNLIEASLWGPHGVSLGLQSSVVSLIKCFYREMVMLDED